MPAAATIPIIDVDSHVAEPTHLWTDRVSKKWGDLVPHVRFNQETGDDTWYIGDQPFSPWGLFANNGWKEHFPSYPRTVADADPGTYDPVQRLHKLDENGVQAQVIYPNLIGFFAETFMKLDPDLGIACIQAYNDFLSDYCRTNSARLIPLTTLPFWDLEASVAEMERCKTNGHKGVLFAHTFEKVGLPNIPDPHWALILDAAQSLEQSINFHIGFAAASDPETEDVFLNLRDTPKLLTVEQSSYAFMSNARAIAMITLHGVCQRYPRLKFVCVESGFGYIPFFLEALDWQWENNAMRDDHPAWMLPSEYFRRQIYATMWFERPPAELVAKWQDNLMWETDYPHTTAQWPTPTSEVVLPAAEAVEASLGTLEPGVRQKVLHDNACRVYHLP